MSKPFAIVTGGSRGIGYAIAEYLAAQDYDLALVARNETRLIEAKQRIGDKFSSINVDTYPVDLQDIRTTHDLIDNMITKRGRVDVLFNNAGVAYFGGSDIDFDQFEEMLTVNVSGAFAVAKAVAAHMKKQQHGYIINLASMAGLRPLAVTGAYSATKHAVVGFSNALYQEMLPLNVKVCVLCPSMIDTDMTQRWDFPNEDKIQLTDLVRAVEYLLQQGPTATTPVLEVHCKRIDISGM